MKKLIYISIAGTLILSACSGHADPKSDTYASDTKDAAKDANKTDAAVDQQVSNFMVEAASSGMMEVELGQMAQRNAASQQVKDFGSMMVTDHSKANEELKAIASAKNVTLPPMPEGKHRDHMTELGKMSGSEFDKEYMNMMVKDHAEDIAKFERAANSNDADVKAFANKTLPVLRAHHEKAKGIQQQLNGNK
ncbi:MAG TPA: DUF4142 domain-containing protein [Chitinophagaceae bacterium]|nr:DUF4142 domain-containing protein [Chitinophagaceae bacterium]